MSQRRMLRIPLKVEKIEDDIIKVASGHLELSLVEASPGQGPSADLSAALRTGLFSDVGEAELALGSR